jgi:hypothetical protein
MFGIFTPKVNGKLTPGGKLLEKIKASEDTPERIVETLFSAPKTGIKSGAVEALTQLKRGFDRYLEPEAAKDAWNDIRLAHWAKMTQGTNGQLLGYDALKNNLKAAFAKQGSLTNKLYTPAERAYIGRFVRELDRITYKDPNPSRSAIGVSMFARQFGGFLLDRVPAARLVFEWSGLPEHFNSQAAKRAVSQATNQARAQSQASRLAPLVPAAAQARRRD